MSNQNIKVKIDNGTYTLKEKAGKSEIWKKFKQVFDEDGVLVPDIIACDNCHNVFSFHSRRTGTSTLIKHKCMSTKDQGKSIASFFKEKEKIASVKKPSQEDKKLIIEKITKFVCLDLRSFNLIKGVGFQELAQSFISLGSKYGDVDVTEILPDPTTISRNINKIAQPLRDEVKIELSNTVAEWGGAVTLDMWTDD